MVSKVVAAAIVVGGLVAIAAIILVLIPLQRLGEPPAQNQLASSCKGSAKCISGTITKVVDGDTLDIDKTRIRLALVNTPEVGEDGYPEAKQFTSSLCPLGSKAVADEDDEQTGGSYGRVIAEVTCGGQVLNEELLKADLAEILTDFCGRSEFARDSWARQYGC